MRQLLLLAITLFPVLAFSQSIKEITPDLLVRIMNGEKRSDVYEIDRDVAFGTLTEAEIQSLVIKAGETLAICGDLKLDKNSLLKNEGNLIISGSLILDENDVFNGVPTAHKLENSGYIIVGKDFKGVDEIQNPQNNQIVTSGYMAIGGNLKVHHLTNSGYVWTSTTHRGSVGGVKVVGSMGINIIREVAELNHVVHHFENLKSKKCSEDEDQNLSYIEVKFDEVFKKQVIVAAKEQDPINKGLQSIYKVTTTIKDEHTVEIGWNIDVATAPTIKNITVQKSDNNLSFNTISEQPSASLPTGQDFDVAFDETKSTFYRLVALKNNNTVDTVIVKGPVSRLQYFRDKFGPNLQRHSKTYVGNNGKNYVIYYMEGDVSLIDNRQHSYDLLEIKDYEIVMVCGNLELLSKYRLHIEPHGALQVDKSISFKDVPYTTNKRYDIQNKGIILVGENFETQTSGKVDDLSIEGEGALVVGEMFKNNGQTMMDGAFCACYDGIIDHANEGSFVALGHLKEIVDKTPKDADPDNAVSKMKRQLAIASKFVNDVNVSCGSGMGAITFDILFGHHTTLPVTLSTFTAKIQDENVTLDWIDEQEVNVDFFEISRSTNGKKFKVISERIKAAGNSEKREVYNYIDDDVPNSSLIYYKLTEYDFDGNAEEWTRIVHTEGNSDYNVNVFPIPADTKLNVEVQNVKSDLNKMNIQLINVVNSQQFNLDGNVDMNNVEFNVSEIPPGIYLMEVYLGKKMIHNQKVIIQ